jgi:Flp pilus assembly pilin Flp
MDLFTSVLVRAQNVLLLRLRSESGQTLAEYSMLMTVISVAVVIIAVIAFRTALAEAWNSAAACLSALGACS